MSTLAPSLADQFRQHFGHLDHLYGILLDALATDLEAGGPTAWICRDHLTASRGDAVQLRLLAGIHRLVLRGVAPGLARWWDTESAGLPTPAQATAALLPVLTEHADELHRALEQAPQTNEVGRSACLLVGLFEAVRRYGLSRIRLLEAGASAGLNLNLDHYRFSGPGWSWGPPESPLHLQTGARCVRQLDFQIVERRGCDLAPVDATTQEGATYLRSFVWPFDRDRRRRLDAALTVVSKHPVAVDDAVASAWVDARLAEPTYDGVLTVVWQSITEQYWPAEESAAVRRAIAGARERMPITHITLEGLPPAQGSARYSVPDHGPALRIDDELIAHSHHHGPPIVLR